MFSFRNAQITEAIGLQMEVERKLHEQLEVIKRKQKEGERREKGNQHLMEVWVKLV